MLAGPVWRCRCLPARQQSSFACTRNPKLHIAALAKNSVLELHATEQMPVLAGTIILRTSLMSYLDELQLLHMLPVYESGLPG